MPEELDEEELDKEELDEEELDKEELDEEELDEEDELDGNISLRTAPDSPSFPFMILATSSPYRAS
jgi:hypothetical protein